MCNAHRRPGMKWKLTEIREKNNTQRQTKPINLKHASHRISWLFLFYPCTYLLLCWAHAFFCHFLLLLNTLLQSRIFWIIFHFWFCFALISFSMRFALHKKCRCCRRRCCQPKPIIWITEIDFAYIEHSHININTATKPRVFSQWRFMNVNRVLDARLIN